MTALANISPAAAARLRDIQTQAYDQPVRINSRDFEKVSGDVIGLQSKPNQAVTSTGSIYGGQVSPRLASGIALTGSEVGFHVDTDLKGTAGGNIGGDVRGMEVEMVSDLGSGRTVAGNVIGTRYRSNIDATVTGLVLPIDVPVGEAAAGQWDGFARLGAVAAVFDSADTNTAGTKRGFIKVWIDGTARFLRLYDSGV